MPNDLGFAVQTSAIASLVSCAIISIFACFAAPALADETSTTKATVPPPADVASAEKIIRDTYKTELASTVAVRKALVRKLLDEAAALPSDAPAADRFTLLHEAQSLAMNLGEYALADEAIQNTAEHFEVDVGELEGQLVTSAQQFHTPGAAAFAGPIAMTLSTAAANSDDFKAADKWVAVAQDLAARSRDPGLLSSAKENQARIRLHASDYDKAHAGRETLKNSPGDADALLAVGMHLCIDHDDWSTGLPLLAKGSDEKLAALARAEATDPQGEAAAQLGDQWFAYSEDSSVAANVREAAAHRAAHWYRAALPRLAGLRAKLAEKRIADVTKAASGREGIFLSDLTPTREAGFVVDSFWGLTKDHIAKGVDAPISIKAKPYAHGLGFNVGGDNGTVSIVYDLHGKYRRFSGFAGVDDSAAAFTATLTYKILGDGKELWVSKPIQQGRRIDKFSVSVWGVKTLELQLVCNGSRELAHSAWVDPHLEAR